MRLKQFLGYQSEVRQPPHIYGTRVNVTGQNPKKPESIEEAVSGPEKLKWKNPWKWKYSHWKKTMFGILLSYQKEKSYRKQVGIQSQNWGRWLN